MTRKATAVFAAFALTALPGCLVTSHQATSYSGNRVEPGAERAVLLNRTTVHEAIATLGEPSDRVTGDNGEETLTWRWTRTHSSDGSVFLVFGGSRSSTESHALHITFRDGVAVRKWRS